MRHLRTSGGYGRFTDVVNRRGFAAAIVDGYSKKVEIAQMSPPAHAVKIDSAFAPRGVRLASLLVATICLTVLSLAAWLQPNPLGVSSHTRLGLQRCEFLYRTGIPCPSCGMTTSFTWFVRGNLVASVYVHPMGAMLALLSAICVSGGYYVAITGRPIYRLLGVLPGRYYLTPLLALAVLGWAWKIWIHLKGLDGWH